MTRPNIHQKDSTTIIKIVCTVFLFVGVWYYFSFLHERSQGWLYAFASVAVYWLIAFIIRRFRMHTILRYVWVNLLVVAVILLAVGIKFDSLDIAYYCKQVIKHIEAGEYKQALAVGKKSNQTTSQLMMLRIDALLHERMLGESLFEYPLIRENIGELYAKGRDCELCAYLIEKRIDDFARALSKYYSVDDYLPKHYREALTLYTHLRSHPVVEYHNNVMDTDFNDLQELETQYHDKASRKMAVRRAYSGTYWYYYEYINN